MPYLDVRSRVCPVREGHPRPLVRALADILHGMRIGHECTGYRPNGECTRGPSPTTRSISPCPTSFVGEAAYSGIGKRHQWPPGDWTDGPPACSGEYTCVASDDVPQRPGDHPSDGNAWPVGAWSQGTAMASGTWAYMTHPHRTAHTPGSFSRPCRNRGLWLDWCPSCREHTRDRQRSMADPPGEVPHREPLVTRPLAARRDQGNPSEDRA